MQVVMGILLAPVVALWRLVRPLAVRRAEADEVIDLRHRVLREGRPREDAIWDGDRDPSTRHWVATWGGEIVGVATVLSRTPPDADTPGWQLRGMAVSPGTRKRGVGRALLEALTAEVGEPLWCNARAPVVDFYARHGWTAVGEPFDIPRIGPHVRMHTADATALVPGRGR